MITAFQEFLKLYIYEDISSQDFILSFVFLYLNAGLYLVDLYRLMERKSKAETFSVMAIPGIFVVMSQALAACLIHVPNPLREASQRDFVHLVEVTMLPQTNIALLSIALLYLILWGIGFLRQRGHERGNRRRWLLSCIPDYITWFLLIFGVCFHLFCRENILQDILRHSGAGNWRLLYTSYGTWLHVWMYAIYILACKEAVLLVGFLSELLLLRIPLRYHSGQNASAFVPFYYLFCQNSVLRGTFLAESMLVFPICATAFTDPIDDMLMMTYNVFFLLVGMVFVILTVIRPIMRTLAYFDAWGERRQIRELFCREYFLSQPLIKNRAFTVTYHFIIDEKDAAGVYYIPLLTKVSGWMCLQNKKEKVKHLIFADGRTLELAEHEMDSAKEMLSYASNRLCALGEDRTPGTAYQLFNTPETKESWNPFRDHAETIYQKVFKFFFILILLLFIMFPQLLRHRI